MLFSFTAFAQKTVYVFNFSSYTVQVSEFNTKHSTSSNNYPIFKSNSTLITIPSGQTYTLINPNNAYFPFYSPTSIPTINNWYRKLNPTSNWVNFTSINLNNVNATPQRFNSLKFQVGTNGSLGGGDLGFSPYSDFIEGNGWAADFTTEGAETVILIYDL